MSKVNKKALTTLMAALTALIVAATPGIIELLDTSEDKARKEAAKSSDQAQKSKEMTELAWEKVRLQLIYMREEIKELKENDKAKNSLLAEILLDRARVANIRPAMSSRSFKALRNPKEPDSLEGITLDKPHEAAKALEAEAQEEDSAPMQQQQLPEDLEAAWVEEQEE